MLSNWKEARDGRGFINKNSFFEDISTPVQPATPVDGTVQIKQLIVVPDRVLCTRYFVLYKYRTQFVYDYTRTVHQLTGLTGQNMEVLNQPYSGQLAYSIRFM